MIETHADSPDVTLRRAHAVFRSQRGRLMVNVGFNPRRRLVLIAGVVGIAVAILPPILWLVFGTRRATVRGRSMAPLLENGELVLVDRLTYWWSPPRRGDVALVRGQPREGPNLLLKRIVGLPGEVVTLAHDRLLIDGQPLDLGRPVIGSGPGTWALSPDEYFLLSENLAVGTDSRHTGPVQRADLLGRAWLVYAPTVRRLPPWHHARLHRGS